MFVILIDLVAEERSKLVRLLRRSLAARLGVRDRAEARAVGKRGKDFVLVRWAEGVWGVSGPKRRDVLRPGPMEIRAVLVAARTNPITQKILASLILCFDEQLDWSVDDIPAELLEVRPLLDDVPPDIVDRLQGVLDRSSLPLMG